MKSTRPTGMRMNSLALASMWMCASLPVFGADEQSLPTVIITGSETRDLIGVAGAASEGMVTAKQLANRPLLRAAEVLESVPGMVVTQHSGDGKANQYFLRGFNLDHGSDFLTHVMGMPVNMVSHAHGQGYMDLNFLIPELIGSMKYKKGTYSAEDGNFAAAGSARIDYQRAAAPRMDLTVGQHSYRRFLAAGSTEAHGLTLLGGVELASNDGPWVQPENLQKRNAVFRASSGTASDGFAATAMLYKSDWTATEHVPERAIDSGEIGRFEALSANDGGSTHRHSLSAQWARSLEGGGGNSANLYVIDYRLNLFSSPSGYVNGLQGDQHEQADKRVVWGGDVRHTWLLGSGFNATEVTAGVQLRADRIAKVGLYDTVDRVRTNTVREDKITETNVGLLVDAKTQWTPWLRSSVGARFDEIRASAVALGGQFNMDNGGDVAADQFSPKLGAVFGPFKLLGQTEFYGNWGHGFHSNDVRGATAKTNPQDGSSAEAVPLIVRAKGAELGMRAAPLPGWNTSLSVWTMELASELVFIGDEGVTEPKGASRRRGLEWSNHFIPMAGLLVDADLTLSRARFKQEVNGANRVPNAVPLTASIGLTFDDGGPWFAGLRARYLGSYDLEETGTEKSRAYWMSNLKLGYRVGKRWQATLDILNVFDKKANDIEYWGGACTRSEAVAGTGGCGSGTAIDGRLVHPLEPRSLRLGVSFTF